MTQASKIISSEQYHWDSVTRKEYKTTGTGFKDIVRYELLGSNDDEHALNAQTRYFEVSPGGYSSLERHEHPHSVVILRGSGSVILGNRYSPVKAHDVIYIAPMTVHQFLADNHEPLGFLCVVDRVRDRPQTPSGQEELREWISDEQVRTKARI